MPELGTYGSVRGARGNSRPYRDHNWDIAKVKRMTQVGGGVCIAAVITGHHTVLNAAIVPPRGVAALAKLALDPG